MLCRVFYFLSASAEQVSSSQPIDLPAGQVWRDLVAFLEHEDDYVGIIDAYDNVLQIARDGDGGDFWVEIPMADEHGDIVWFAPDPRAIIELDALKLSRSLRTVIQRGVFEVTMNRAFSEVIEACADRDEGTWISSEIREAYCELHRLGFGHSVETWKDGEKVE